jgi:hypothetical protein
VVKWEKETRNNGEKGRHEEGEGEKRYRCSIRGDHYVSVLR